MKFIRGFCGSFTFDGEKGNLRVEPPSGIELEEIPESRLCPVCGNWKAILKKLATKRALEIPFLNEKDRK